MPKLILRKHPTGPGELAYEIHDDEATRLVEAGKAIRLPDGILRELVTAKAVKELTPESSDEGYTTKEIKPAKKAKAKTSRSRKK